MRYFISYILGILLCIPVISQQPNSTALEIKFSQVLRGEAEQDFTIGLALGAGAAKGFAHVGVLKALEEAGVRIDMIAGSSMGAIIGGGYASGLSPAELEEISLNSDWLDVLNLIDPIFPTRGFIDGQKIKEFLDEIYGGKNIEDLNIPFSATTVDILKSELYVINSGNLANAARASGSIPIVFNPLSEGDKVLVDGGMIDPVPIDVVRSMGADYIIAVNVLALPEKRDDSFQYLSGNNLKISRSRWRIPNEGEAWYTAGQPNLAEIAHETVILSMALIAETQVELAKPDMTINVNTGLSAWNFLDAEIAIDKGYEDMKKSLNITRAKK
ncbi:MAG: patatin-like phospholipase family protein [Candidatus Marinimicrobia bacterium]|nr:patatin-like phospholipase family protein [Candidatus Neomarinimicrobiota bacterium]MCF7851369.1 patatin-like phospholipase family protein [Candidatus Neomarinimicrobiota bacterium]MCF7904203.1 patatin-like phospholipase family protein [Candidatus Neomarinimicrobiota bacterium]